MEWIQQYQTLIVGIFGFAGVVGTLCFNARLERRQRQQEIRHERGIIRTALAEELKIIRKAFEDSTGSIENVSETGGLLVPAWPMDETYRAFIDRIGLLSREEVRAVMDTYVSLRAFNASLFLFGTPTHTNGRYIRIPSSKSKVLLDMMKGLIPKIEGALRIMEQAQEVD